MTNIICSGYFAPIHSGHIAYLKYASQLGRLFVIVNNDKQTILKDSIPFMNEKERLLIIKNLKFVSNALISIDEDRSVRESIKYIYEVYNKIYPNEEWIFANGGPYNRFNANTEEMDLCHSLGIKYMFGFGGVEKNNSSSSLIEKSAKLWINKNWTHLNNKLIRQYIKNVLYPSLSLKTRNELNRVLHEK